MRLSNGIVLVVLLGLVVSSIYASEEPEQIRISYGDTPDSMTITWSTRSYEYTMATYVSYGSGATSLNTTVNANVVNWSYGNALGAQYTHSATLTGLTAGATYFYQCITGTYSSAIFHFSAMPAGSDWVQKFLVFGDMGKEPFLGRPQALDSLINQVNQGYPVAAIHVGDFAYDLDSLDGLNGDVFMQQIQDMAAFIPYMTAIGNHENNYNSSNYINRFRMPNYESTKNMWYSWDIGLVHFIAYSTETIFYDADNFTTDWQLEWLENDLIKANANRDKQPWIIAYGHRPFYCSNTDHDDCTYYYGKVRATFEDLFYFYGVDIVLEAHEHSYERLWPVYNYTTVLQFNYTNPLAPVHLISGAAGCNENVGFCINPIDGPLGPWSAFRSSGLTTYGYARMEIHNATHLFYEEVQAWEDDKVLDSVWITQNNHGQWKFPVSSS